MDRRERELIALTGGVGGDVRDSVRLRLRRCDRDLRGDDMPYWCDCCRAEATVMMWRREGHQRRLTLMGSHETISRAPSF